MGERPGTWIVVGVAFALAGCGKDDKKSDEKAGEVKTPTRPTEGAAAKPPAASSWTEGEVPSFRARYSTSGEATKTAVTGTIYVGPEAVRVDIENHPNAGGPKSFIRTHDEDDLWDIDSGAKSFDRALSGDWEHRVIPHVIEAKQVDDIAEGECPFGPVKPEDCTAGADTEVAGIPVQTWTYRGRTIWISPELRVGLKESYTPYRNNPATQVVELSEIERGPQDPALFKVPADFTCNAGGFCDSAPR